MSDIIDDATKKMKNAQQDYNAKAETEQDHAEGKPSSETLNKAKEKVKDAFSWIFFAFATNYITTIQLLETAQDPLNGLLLSAQKKQ